MIKRFILKKCPPAPPPKEETLLLSSTAGWARSHLLPQAKLSVWCPKHSFPSYIWKKKNKKKNLILCSPLWHARKPEATKNGLSLRKACVTPVWPHRLLSPPSLLQRTQDLRRWGGKLIHFSWRQWLSVSVCVRVFSSSISFTDNIHTCMHMLTDMRCAFSSDILPILVCISRIQTQWIEMKLFGQQDAISSTPIIPLYSRERLRLQQHHQ